MLRLLSAMPVALGLIAAGCVRQDPAANASIDIARAASEAQGTIDAYGQTVAVRRAARARAAPAPSTSDMPDLAPLTPPAPGTPGGLPDDRTPRSKAPFAPDSAQGAANVVQTYYALIGEGRHVQARALWEPGAAGAGATPAAFAERFARYAEYHATVGAPGRIDSGAGQRYVEVPVQIAARFKRGSTPVYEIGSAILHRTGDVGGATVEQRRWRIQRIDTSAAPAAAPLRAAAAASTGYRCIDGRRLTVVLDPAAGIATVHGRDKMEAVLKARRAMPGVWDKADGHALRIAGDRATYTRPGSPPLACAAR